MSKRLGDDELQWQLYQTVTEMQRTVGSWEAVVVTEQAETLIRFLDHQQVNHYEQ